MESNKKHTLDIFEKHKGEHVLIDGTVKRFIAIAEDKMDFLYVMWNGRKTEIYTILSSLIIIKDKIDDYDYKHLQRISSLNDLDSINMLSPRTAELKEQMKKISDSVKAEVEFELRNPTDDSFKLLSEICWDMN